jgi:hypothetical protein
MTVRLPQRPEDGAVLERIGRTLPQDAGLSVGSRDDHEPFYLSPPYPLYTTRLATLDAVGLIGGARLACWQYVIFRHRRVAGLVQVTSHDGELRYGASFPQSVAEDLVAAVTRAEQAHAGGAPVYELRVLDLPRVLLRVVWLASKGDDRFFPVQRVPPGIDVQREYTESSLNAALVPLIDDTSNDERTEPP